MSKGIKATIEINGTIGASLNSAINGISEKFAALNRNASRIGGGFAGLAMKVKGISDVFAPLTGGVKGFGNNALNAGMGFEEQMSRVAAVSRATDAQLAQLTETAKELGAKTAWSASQAAEGMQYLAMAGFKANEIVQAMPGMLDLASAGAVDLGKAADIASNILTGFGLKAEETGRLGDVLVNTFTTSNTTLEMLGNTMKYAAPIAKAYGMNLETVAGMAAKLGDAGIQGEMAGTALRGMMTRLSKPTSEMNTVLSALKINLKDAGGNMKDMPSLLAELAEKEKQLSAAGKLSANATLFGTEALSAATVLMEQAASGSLQEYIEGLSASGTAAQTAKKQTDNLKGDLTILQSVLESLYLTLYDSVQPALRNMAQSTQNVIGGIKEWCENHKELTKAIVSGAAALTGIVSAVAPVVAVVKALAFLFGGPINAGIAIFAGLAFAAKAAYDNFEPFRELVDSIWGKMKAFGEWVGNTFLAMWTGNWTAVRDNFASVWVGLTEIVKAPINAVIGLINKALEYINGISFEVPDWIPGIGGKKFGANMGQIPMLASGGIVTAPTAAVLGEGGESEAVLPLSKLEGMVGGEKGGMVIHYAPVINVSGGEDAYAGVKKALGEGMRNLRFEMERLMTEQRRVMYY